MWLEIGCWSCGAKDLIRALHREASADTAHLDSIIASKSLSTRLFGWRRLLSKGTQVIISHTHKYIFIKSAKTAGTSIEAALSLHCSGQDVVTSLGDYAVNRDEQGQWVHRAMNSSGFAQHEWGSALREKVGPEIWNSYFKFSVARNPWDRVVSLYTWMARNDPSRQPHMRFYHRFGVPFDEIAETRRLFSKFVFGDWQTNDRFYIIDGECCVDFIIRYESLLDDLTTVCKKVGLPELELPRLKSGIRPARYHYSTYYDEESKAIVAERHRNDIRLFGYKFEEMS